MNLLRKRSSLILEICLLAAVFCLTFKIPYSADIWFHIKSGEVIAEKGIIHYDVFGFNTTGREWFPYEWLFQVSVFYIQKLFGLAAIKLFAAAVTTFMVFLFTLILKEVLNLNKTLSLVISFFFFASIYEFITQRPQIFSYTFTTLTLFLILQYIFKNKNLLWLSTPITLIWSNMHGSMFLSIYLFLGYAVVNLINYFVLKEKSYLNKFKTLFFFGLINAVLTILPPLGFLQYKLLAIFYKERWLITTFINEWVPLPENNPVVFKIYTAELILVLILFVITNWKDRFKNAIWILPLLGLLITPFTAARNLALAYIALILILAWCINKLPLARINKFVSVIFIIVFIALNSWVIFYKGIPDDIDYTPVKAAQFIKDYHLNGHMLNDYNYGGYLLYILYPDQKVFIDGRTDLYLCCEFRDITDVSLKKTLPDPEFKKFVDKTIVEKYDISFALVRTVKHLVIRKLSRIWEDDPNWSLIYWDDVSQIFVRHDGKNNALIEKLGAKVATPYNKDPFLPGQTDQALEEYIRMIKIVDSSRSRNALGFIMLQKGNFEEAKLQFEKAISLNPYFESPYMNLAELAVKGGSISKAIELYQTARQLAWDRGLIYIRLGELMLQNGEDINKVRAIWQEGVDKTVDADAKTKLKQLISNL